MIISEYNIYNETHIRYQLFLVILVIDIQVEILNLFIKVSLLFLIFLDFYCSRIYLLYLLFLYYTSVVSFRSL